MVIRDETIRLQHPNLHALPRLEDQWSFLYLDEARIVQDDTGVVALLENDAGGRVLLPVASIAAILLGPGTSITQAALATISRHGTTIAWVGADGTRTHGWAYGLTSSARWAEAQATLWANPNSRRDVAIAMYRRRFGALPPGTPTLQRLRGLEGQRMKQTYSLHARKAGIKFKRRYDPDKYDDADPVNQALTAANAALYGVALAAITAIGCHPALGFIHAGSIHAFAYDIADLYKAEIAIPAAFQAAGTDPLQPGKTARRLVRHNIVRHQLLSRAVRDIQELLQPGLVQAAPGELLLYDDHGYAEGGRNHADETPPDIELGFDQTDPGSQGGFDDDVFDLDADI